MAPTPRSTQQAGLSTGHDRGDDQGDGRGQDGAVAMSWVGDIDPDVLTRGLGWFSIGLGVAELVSPAGVAHLAGAPREHRMLIRALGLREIAHGMGIVSHRRPVGWIWSRVAGDALDLACLGAAFASPRARRTRLAVAAGAVLGVTLLDILASQQVSRRAGVMTDRGALRTSRSVTIRRPVEEVYQFWRNLENLPRFMSHLESVRVLDEGRRSHWIARGPGGLPVEWDAELIEDEPNQLIAWRSLPGADVDNAGSVRFRRAPGDRGTEILVELEYRPPGGPVGAGIAMLFGREPSQQVKGDLFRLKQVMETGEVIHSDASIHRGPHPAQPSRDTSPAAASVGSGSGRSGSGHGREASS